MQSTASLTELWNSMAPSCERQISAGGFVFQQGDSASQLYLVRHGRIRLVRYTADGQRCTLFVAETGQTFAEAALFAERYHCFALADTDSRVAGFDKQLLLAHLRENPDMALGYIALLSLQVHELRTLIELRTVRSAKERVLTYLLQHAEPGSNTIRVARTLKDMAQELGLAHETLYRTLAELEREGRVERGPAAIKLKKNRCGINVSCGSSAAGPFTRACSNL
jgi:CRP-like cAMP-binding protein